MLSTPPNPPIDSQDSLRPFRSLHKLFALVSVLVRVDKNIVGTRCPVAVSDWNPLKACSHSTEVSDTGEREMLRIPVHVGTRFHSKWAPVSV